MTQFKEFLTNNTRSLLIVISFIMTIYVQHTMNTAKITELTTKCNTLEQKIEDQYKHIDAIKLDKAVFEANMVQFSSIQADIREIQKDIKELLKSVNK